MRRSASQPLVATPSQLPKPVVQVSPQVPAEQSAVEFDPEGHTVPQRPQLATVLWTSTSQPLVATPSQLPKPGVQVMPQAPVVHEGAEFAPDAQTVPQAPQLRGSLAVVTQVPLQRVVPAMQASMQEPAEQSCPLPHEVPQRPQLVALVWRLTSQPSAALPLQSAKPVRQVKPQAPDEHVEDALAGGRHTVPQAPQLSELFVVLTSQPLEATRSQSPKPVLHAKPQPPATQVARAFVGAAHAFEQRPQCVRLELVSTQAPPQEVPPPGQAHTPPVQLWPPVQAVPQRPQLALSESGSTQRPPQKA